MYSKKYIYEKIHVLKNTPGLKKILHFSFTNIKIFASILVLSFRLASVSTVGQKCNTHIVKEWSKSIKIFERINILCKMYYSHKKDEIFNVFSYHPLPF
jgi:hypothetical protein